MMNRLTRSGIVLFALSCVSACVPPSKPPVVPPTVPYSPSQSISTIPLVGTLPMSDLVTAAESAFPTCEPLDLTGAITMTDSSHGVEWAAQRVTPVLLVPGANSVDVAFGYRYYVRYLALVGHAWVGITTIRDNGLLKIRNTISADANWHIHDDVAVSGGFAPAVDQYLQQQVSAQVTAHLADAQQRLHDEAAREWSLVSSPQDLGGGFGWFSPGATQISIGTVNSDCKAAQVAFALQGYPEISLEKPTTSAPPLPSPGAFPPSNTFAANMGFMLDFAQINKAFSTLVGTTHPIGDGQTARIDGLDVSGEGETLILSLRLHVSWLVHGTVFLLGGLRYNPRTYVLYVPRATDDPSRGLHVDVNAGNLPTAILAGLAKSELLSKVQSVANWQMASNITGADAQLTKIYSSMTNGSGALSGLTLSCDDRSFLVSTAPSPAFSGQCAWTGTATQVPSSNTNCPVPAYPTTTLWWDTNKGGSSLTTDSSASKLWKHFGDDHGQASSLEVTGLEWVVFHENEGEDDGDDNLWIHGPKYIANLHTLHRLHGNNHWGDRIRSVEFPVHGPPADCHDCTILY